GTSLGGRGRIGRIGREGGWTGHPVPAADAAHPVYPAPPPLLPGVIDRIRRFIREHDLILRRGRVVAAVSGGPVSVALAHVLHDLDRAGDLVLAGIAHFNHQLRPIADRDEAHVHALAEALGVPLFAGRADVAARARAARLSIEHAARDARHEFLA